MKQPSSRHIYSNTSNQYFCNTEPELAKTIAPTSSASTIPVTAAPQHFL